MKIITPIILSLILVVGVINAADPLSRDGLQPTIIPFEASTAIVSDTLGGFPDVAYFMIIVSEGEQLTSIVVTADESSDGGYWFAVMSGEQFTETSTQTSQINTDNILGHEVIGGTSGINVLPNMVDGSFGSGAIGFDDVLPAGTYAFRIQNWGSGGTFTLELMIESAVSAPTAVRLNTVTFHRMQLFPIVLLMEMGLMILFFATCKKVHVLD